MQKISIRDVDIYPDSFSYRDRTYRFHDAIHLRIYRRVLSTHMALPVEFTKIGAEEHIGIKISMRSSEEFLLSEQPGWLRGANQGNVEKILKLYNLLAHATLMTRIESYTTHANQHGYFYYGGYRFYPEHQYIEDDRQQYSRQNTAFLKGYGYLELRPKELSAATKLVAKFKSQAFPRIDTLTDTDAIFVILNEYFSLHWK